jgi:hypothetical protein
MQSPILVKTPHRQSYTETIHNCIDYEHKCHNIHFKMQDIKHLSEITPGVFATAERGARFHPTVGSANPNGFTTSHPRAETTMLRD